MFEAVRGATEYSDIAIDDIVIKDGECPPPAFCDFEIDMCSWTNVLVTDDIDWIWSSGNTPSRFPGPTVDHTTGSGSGTSFILKIDNLIINY